MITGWEAILIVIIVAALIIWGPKKIPELARAIGEAKGEFERASREASLRATLKKREEVASDDFLIETAKKMGINTEGKTKEQIFMEILEKVKSSKESNQ